MANNSVSIRPIDKPTPLLIRSYSSGCALDAGGLPVVWLTDVRPAASVKLLRSLVASGTSEEKGDRRVEEPALAALAFHADPSALEALIGLARQDASAHVRGQALFWLAQRAGSKVAGVITRAIEDDPHFDLYFALRALLETTPISKLEEAPYGLGDLFCRFIHNAYHIGQITKLRECKGF